MNLARIIGEEHQFSVEHRILNTVLVVGFILAVLSGIFNYLLDIGPVMVGFSVSCTLLSIGIYYLSRVKRLYTLAVRVLTLVAIFLVTPIMWFYNGGLWGGTPLYILVFSSMLATLLQGRSRILGVATLFGVSMSLIFLEYKNPSWIVRHATVGDHYADVTVALMSTLFGNSVLFIMILNHYVHQKNKAQEYYAQVERQRMERSMARLDRLNIIGEMAASIGHEVRNPMTTVRGFLQLFQRKKDFAVYRDQLDIMIAELDRANGIITEFLALAKDKAINLQRDNLNRIVKAIYPLLEADALLLGREFSLCLEDTPDIMIDENEIRQCVFNLVRNAFEATGEGGVVILSTGVKEGKVFLSVRDNGSGIPQEVYSKLGTPFVTTKAEGTGLGLPVCYRIAERHNAEVEVDTGPEGTMFTLGFRTE